MAKIRLLNNKYRRRLSLRHSIKLTNKLILGTSSVVLTSAISRLSSSCREFKSESLMILIIQIRSRININFTTTAWCKILIIWYRIMPTKVVSSLNSQNASQLRPSLGFWTAKQSQWQLWSRDRRLISIGYVQIKKLINSVCWMLGNMWYYHDEATR